MTWLRTTGSRFGALALLVLAVSCGSDSDPGSGGSGGVSALGGSTSMAGMAGQNAAAAAGSFSMAGSAGVLNAGHGGVAGASGAAGASGGAGDPAGGAGGAATGECGVASPTSCQRGLYVSLYTDHIGQVTFEGEDLLYANMLGSAAAEEHLLYFVAQQEIDTLSLYNLNAILADEGLTNLLESFMDRARMQGLRIEAIGAEGTAIWDAIHDFHHERTPFDGFVTELEFWAGAVTFAEFIDTLEYVRSLSWEPAPGGDAPTLSAYLGWPDADEVLAMAPLLDRVYLHVYVDTPQQAYAYGAERFGMFAAANAELGTNVDVWPIYSAEDTEWAAGAEHFMGEWLGENSVELAETEFMDDWAAADPGTDLLLSGHQYYEFFFLDKYLQ